ncbi:hypothetical protein AMTRI_Chr03g148940 [Amborella trichopoda]
MGAGVELSESGVMEWSDNGGVNGVAFEVFQGGSPSNVPERVRRRLMESLGNKSKCSVSLEEIQAKLREADLRRQQFHEWLSNKAKPKLRSPTWSAQDEVLGQRLEAKLYAAEQKRLEILTQAQMRLARLDELRQAAKTGVLCQEKRYKERMQATISQKRAAAEKKRLGLIEAEKKRAHAMVMQARRVAKTVCNQREIERRKLKERLEDRLQRARRQRAEYLRQRVTPHGSSRVNRLDLCKHGDHLSRKLARCWRQFRRVRRTTFVLAKDYEALDINERSVKSMPFEQLAIRIESATTLQTVKALLERIASRVTLTRSSRSNLANIDHLLKRLSSPSRRGMPIRSRSARMTSSKNSTKDVKSPERSQLLRYPVRVALCAYMILGHPDAVFSGKGEREVALAEAASKFVWELELLVKIMIDGPQSNPGPDNKCETNASPNLVTFRSQLKAFDAAWCSYLYHFVVWKVKDARSLEEDLVRAACQLELSMMQTCKMKTEGVAGDLTHDMKAIQKQVSEDQKLLREKVHHLSGTDGIERMESALSDMRYRFFEGNENGSPLASPLIQDPFSSPDSLVGSSLASAGRKEEILRKPKSHVVRSLFNKVKSPSSDVDDRSASTTAEKLTIENEILVNEIVHRRSLMKADCFDLVNKGPRGVQDSIKATMEKAFWDGITDSLKQDDPDYSWVIQLVKEIRDELCTMVPQNWRLQVTEAIDVDILTQVLRSVNPDIDYLGRILEYALGTLQKLSAPAKENDMRAAHNNLLNDLAEIARVDGKLNSSFAIATIKGLRFVLEEIQALKQEISAARIQLLEPLIQGPAGLEYLQRAFAARYGLPSDSATSLPLTVQWYSSVKPMAEQEWKDHSALLLAFRQTNSDLSSSNGLPANVLKTGVGASRINQWAPGSPMASSPIGHQTECKGETVDVLVRLGLLKFANQLLGVSEETLPETLKLNCLRLRGVQSEIQKAIVVSTSLLVLRQTLTLKKPTSQMNIEEVVCNACKRLTELLNSDDNVGVMEIAELLMSVNSSEEGERLAKKELMARLLAKSLLPDDPVFSRVSQAVYTASRALILVGGGPCGEAMAEMALKRIGAGLLVKQLAEIVEVLSVMCSVSRGVHGPWYSWIAQNV